MNPTLPTCTPTVTPVGPWFLLQALSVEIPDDLKTDKYALFDYALDFAGRSARGIALSVKRSAGPARIGAYPVVEHLSHGWIALPSSSGGFLLRTGEPHLAFYGINPKAKDYEDCYSGVGVLREDLAEIVETADHPNREPTSTEVPVKKFSPEIVRLLAQYDLKVILLASGSYVRVPVDLGLREDHWALLSRHLFTENAVGELHQTVPFQCHPRGWTSPCIRFPGKTLRQVMDTCGIREATPCGFDGTHLFFATIRIDDASKVSRLYPQIKDLGGRTLRVHDSIGRKDEFGAPPVQCGGPFPLQQAIDAGAIPQHGEIIVDNTLERVFLPQAAMAKLQRPLQYSYRGPSALLCPASLVSTYLLRTARAKRIYRVSSGLREYRVLTIKQNEQREVDLEGSYYLLSDLAALAKRDFQLERAETEARHDRLVARFGPDLPRGYQRHTDEEIELYFWITKAMTRGELVPVDNHPLLPGRYRRYRFLKWIRKVKADAAVTCPITHRVFLRSLGSLDDLAELPGFWAAVEETLGESIWLRQLMLNATVRAAALAHAS